MPTGNGRIKIKHMFTEKTAMTSFNQDWSFVFLYETGLIISVHSAFSTVIQLTACIMKNATYTTQMTLPTLYINNCYPLS